MITAFIESAISTDCAESSLVNLQMPNLVVCAHAVYRVLMHSWLQRVYENSILHNTLADQYIEEMFETCLCNQAWRQSLMVCYS